MMLQSWADATTASLLQVWSEFLAYVPRILGAAIIFILGLIVASVVSSLVIRALRTLRVDHVVSQTGIDKEFERSGLTFSLSAFFGKLVYWLILIATIVLVTDSLFSAGTVTTLLAPVFAFIPNVVFAIIILLGAVVLANFLKSVVQAAVVGARLHAPKFLGSVAWWTTVIFGFIAALRQLGIGDFITTIAMYAIIAALFGSALAFGLAFGLGGRERATELLNKWKGMM